MAAEPRKPGFLNYLGWGSGDVLGAGVTAVTATWLLYFYTTFCGLSLSDAGWLLSLPRFFDAITCPLIGYISDNLRHTWVGRHIGRRKIFLLIAIPLLPSFALMWVSGQTFLYYLCSLLFFELVYNCVLIPWETLAAEMSTDYKVKSKFAGAHILIAQAAAVLAVYLPTLIINQLGGKDSPNTFLINGAIFGALSSFVVILVVLFSWERPYTEAEMQIRPKPLDLRATAMIPVQMFADLFSVLRIRAFRQQLGIYLGGYISQDVFNTALPFFVATVMLGGTLIISQMMATLYAVQFISVIIAVRIVLSIGPNRAYRLAIAAFIAACALYYVFYLVAPAGFSTELNAIARNIFAGALGASPTLLIWLFVPILLAGLGRGALNFVPWSVYTYLPDIDEAMTGQRREGIFAGVMLLIRKLSQFLAIKAASSLMQMGGYVAGLKVQSPGAVHAIVLVMVIGPIVIMIAGFIVSLRFRLNAHTHSVLMGEIARLRNGATAPETLESGAVVEDLTGWKYADLWGRRKAKV